MAGVLLRLLVLKTRQLDALRAFYGALGIELVEEKHGQGPIHYAGRLGDVVLEVYPLPEAHSADATTRLGFAVERLTEVVDTLQTLGAVIVTQPQETAWGRRALVRDPDGRAIELYQR
jgi:lactoylglutathione lyase